MNATEKETLRPSTKATQRELASAMNVHFQQTGTYRAEDILRVLGNPLGGVEVQPSQHAPFMGKIDRR